MKFETYRHKADKLIVHLKNGEVDTVEGTWQGRSVSTNVMQIEGWFDTVWPEPIDPDLPWEYPTEKFTADFIPVQ